MDPEKVAPSVVKSFINIDKNYIKSIVGILKPIEFLMLLLAWALCASFRSGFPSLHASIPSSFSYRSAAVGFFLFVTVTLWLLVIIVYILNVLSLMARVNIPQKALIVVGVHGIWALLLLISTAVIAADAVRLSGISNWCTILNASESSKTTCGTYDGAVAFGVFSCLAFIIDTVVHFFNYRQQQ